MKDSRWVYNRSSMLTSLPALIAELVLCALSGLFGLRGASAALAIVFVLSGVSRLWALVSLRHVSFDVSCPAQGVFPGESLEFHLQIRNGKLIPLVWLELFFPLSHSKCLVPEHTRTPDEWEKPALQEQACSESLVGEERLPFCAWYETVEVVSRWTAQCRGVYSTEGWRLRSGDGFGLTQTERPVTTRGSGQFAVYPSLVGVNTELFLRNLWNADTGSRGVMEDNTVIRSTREYLPGDNLKHINWRLAARNLPLSVNLYEEILPRSVHFLLDGESFSGPEPHLEELEQALSMLASILVNLNQSQVDCGLSLCQGRQPAAHYAAVSGNLYRLLWGLAGYEPAGPVKEEGSQTILRQQARYDLQPLLEHAKTVGRFYYLCYDCTGLEQQEVFHRLNNSQLSLLTWEECRPFGDYETICLRTLRKGALT